MVSAGRPRTTVRSLSGVQTYFIIVQIHSGATQIIFLRALLFLIQHQHFLEMGLQNSSSDFPVERRSIHQGTKALGSLPPSGGRRCGRSGSTAATAAGRCRVVVGQPLGTRKWLCRQHLALMMFKTRTVVMIAVEH